MTKNELAKLQAVKWHYYFLAQSQLVASIEAEDDTLSDELHKEYCATVEKLATAEVACQLAFAQFISPTYATVNDIDIDDIIREMHKETEIVTVDEMFKDIEK